MKIALAGNPNSGKTTLYNLLTGSHESVGNWSGVTVDFKMAPIKTEYLSSDRSVVLVDLPGAYSIAPYSSEEAITRDYIMNQGLDAVINVVDGVNVERSLFFTTQLLALGIPVVVALNKTDILEKRAEVIDIELLSRELGCPVVPIAATTSRGLESLIKAILSDDLDKKIKPAPLSELSHLEEKDILERQHYVTALAGRCLQMNHGGDRLQLSDQLDRVLAHKWLGLPIFFLVMWAVYSFSIKGLGGFLSDYLNDVFFGEIVPGAASNWLSHFGVAPLLQAFIVDGLIGGVGAVAGFLPLIMVLFFCLSLLEDSGYMARVAVVMDRYFKKIGLSGKSIIPMIVGSGCSIPGIMATRTIENINERRMTTLLTPFIPCSAKLPIIALFSAAFFPKATWVGPSMYILAIAVIILGGTLLKRVFVWESTTPFMIELPEYKVPSLKQATRQMVRQAKAFVYKASTIILVMNTFVWLTQTYNFALQPVENQSASMLAAIGGVVAPLLIPLGFVGWQLAAAAITGFIAKENVVATFAILLAAASEEALMGPGGGMATLFNPVTAYAFLVFNLFTPPCFAAMGAMNSELGSKKWLFKAIAFQFTVGYMLALIITQVGSLIVYKTPAVGFLPAMGIAVVFVVGLTLKLRKAPKLEENTGVSV